MYNALFPAKNYWANKGNGRYALFLLAQHTDTGIFQFASNLNNLIGSVCDAYMRTVVSEDGKVHGPGYAKFKIDRTKYKALLSDNQVQITRGTEVDTDRYIKDIPNVPIEK